MYDSKPVKAGEHVRSMGSGVASQSGAPDAHRYAVPLIATISGTIGRRAVLSPRMPPWSTICPQVKAPDPTSRVLSVLTGDHDGNGMVTSTATPMFALMQVPACLLSL